MDKTLKLTLAALAMALAFAAPQSLAQGAVQASFGDAVEVSEVLLDVLVTDRKGNVVLDLGAEDFVVEEDGVPVDVNGISFYSNRFLMKNESRVQHPNEVLADRHFVFVFHDQKRFADANNQALRQQVEALQQSRRWVRDEMLPGDWVAIAKYDVKLHLLQDFTQDRTSLMLALDGVQRGKGATGDWPSRRRELSADQPSLARRLPDGKELRRQTGTVYDALRLVADATGDIVGRKNLLLFTTGFGRLDGIRPFAEADSRFYPQLQQALNDNNVAIYPIDLTPTGYRHLQESVLGRLASDSGGFYYQGFASFLTPMKEIADENNGYYLLSYRAEHGIGESGYQKVRVKPRNPELRMRYRQGYSYGI